LAVWEGCLTAASATGTNYDTGNIVDGTVALGAKCAVGFGDLINIGTGYNDVWASSFWKALTVGEKGDHNLDTVVTAETWATAQVKALKGGQSSGYDSCRWAGDATIKVVPAH
jgi:hypothetical protein